MKSKYFMTQALKEALKAYKKNEVPVGAIITHKNNIIAKAHNIKESTHDPTTHAEIIAIKKASRNLKSWRLNKCNLYVTLEPCPMCIGAILNARIPKLYFGTYDKKAGMCGSRDNLCQQNLLNHNVTYRSGILQGSCQAILDNFFQKIRETK